MEYSDTQIAAADLILKKLLEHESFVNDYKIHVFDISHMIK